MRPDLLLPFADGRRPGATATGSSSASGRSTWSLAAGLDLLIDLIEPLGSETLVHGHLAGGEDQSLTVKLAGAAPAGDRLAVAPQLEHLHVFDRRLGAAN